MSLTKLIQPLDNQIICNDNPLPKDLNLIWCLYGAKGSGKSTLLLNSLKHKEFYKNYFDCIYLVSPTASRDKKFDDLCEELEKYDRLYTTIDENIILEIMDKIRNFNDNFKKKRNPRSLIIFDDCIHLLPKASQKSSIHELITTCRHLKSCIFITSQRFKALNPLIRSNSDIISFFKSNNVNEKKAFCEEYDIKESLLDKICIKNNDFIHITFCAGEKLIFNKFDRI